MTRDRPLNATPLGYADLKELAADIGRPISSLIVLARDNDPFLAGAPGRRMERAEWFAELWRQLEIPHGVHLRRMHYLLVSTARIVLPDGRPYENTYNDWSFLGR